MAEAAHMAKCPRPMWGKYQTRDALRLALLNTNPIKSGAPLIASRRGLYRATHSRSRRPSHDIIVLESPPLARQVFLQVPSWEPEIPSGCIWRVRPGYWLMFFQPFSTGQAGAKRPGPMPKPDIPDDLRQG